MKAGGHMNPHPTCGREMTPETVHDRQAFLLKSVDPHAAKEPAPGGTFLQNKVMFYER
jgi:hypothetical protein